jgi:malto-oligosyltrehalose trehalohydrolase
MTKGLLPTGYGATLTRPGHTRFAVWAPNAAAAVKVHLTPPQGEPMTLDMQPDGQGGFVVEAPVGAGTRYRYQIGDDLKFPDPFSRLQAGDVHDDSIVVDPQSYAWRTPDWKGRPWSEAVLYELHPKAFGGFKGIQAALPKLAELGVTAVELMPIADFPGERNWGYDGVLPYAPDTAYGTPDDLKALVDAAHEQGMMIFLDVVYNHFGPDGNYLHAYASDFFREDLTTPWGPAIDFRRPQVRDFFTRNAMYWVNEFRFDGLRFDAVHAISEPDWLDEMAAAVRASLPSDRHVHLVLEHDGNIASHLAKDFDAQWNDDGHHILHRIIAGETDGYYTDYADKPAEQLARCLAEGFIYQGQPSPHRDGEPRGEPSGDLPPTAFVLFLQNHDQIGNRALGDRLITLAEKGAGMEALRAGVALCMLSPQIPMIFMGEEWGTRTPFLYFTSHNDELAEAVREGRRKEFAKFPAFADPAVRDNIPDPNAAETFEASVPPLTESPGREGMLWWDYYRALLRVRREVLVPHLDGAVSIGAQAIGELAVAARWRLSNGQVYAMYVNFAADAVDITPVIGSQLVFESASDTGRLAATGKLKAGATLVMLEDALEAVAQDSAA